jgi:hypothetical protein
VQVREGTLQRLGPRDVFYESPEDLHALSRNARKNETSEVHRIFIKNEGAPILTPVH